MARLRLQGNDGAPARSRASSQWQEELGPSARILARTSSSASAASLSLCSLFRARELPVGELSRLQQMLWVFAEALVEPRREVEVVAVVRSADLPDEIANSFERAEPIGERRHDVLTTA
jgi:hypothetical protein